MPKRSGKLIPNYDKSFALTLFFLVGLIDSSTESPSVNMLVFIALFGRRRSSESRGDHAGDPEWHKRKLLRLPPHNRCRMGIASTASDGIQSRSGEHRQKGLESQGSERVESKK